MELVSKKTLLNQETLLFEGYKNRELTVLYIFMVASHLSIFVSNSHFLVNKKVDHVLEI